MKKFVILIPHGGQTGGPEALHQLSDVLLSQGHDARVWYVQPSDLAILAELAQNGGLQSGTALRLPGRPNVVEDYAGYRVHVADHIVFSEDTCVVLAEVYVEWLHCFRACRSLIWWLSVDNAFKHLAKVNLNHVRTQRVLHGCQSVYAQQVVRALGCASILPLTDYTPAVASTSGLPRTDIALTAGLKVIYDLDDIAARLRTLCQTDVHLIQRLTRAQVYECLDRSKLFIDLGCFPGKDRLAREALLRDCCVFALDVGGAPEYGLPQECYFKPDDVGQVPAAARHLMQHYDFYVQLHQPARQAVLRERLIFEREVAGMVQAFAV